MNADFFLQGVSAMTNDENVLNMYLKEINKIPLLTKETIVKANLRFVVNVAKKYQNQGLDLLDLISEGNIGLLTAIDRFDVSKGYHFISYAVWWIRQAILKAICEKSRAIRLPLNRVNELVKIEKARKVVGTNKSEEQEITEIGAMLGMETSHVREMLNLSKEMVSLDMQVPGDGAQKRTLGDFLEDNTVPSPDEQAMNTAMKEELNSVLKTLRPNEEKVLRLRYGLNGEKPMSLKEVGDVCNLTKERIRQIEKRALVRMQHPVRLTRLEAYVA